MGLRRGFNPVEERWKQEDVALPLPSSTKESGPDVAVVHYSDPERGAFARLSGFFCCRAAGTPLSLGTGKGGSPVRKGALPAVALGHREHSRAIAELQSLAVSSCSHGREVSDDRVLDVKSYGRRKLSSAIACQPEQS